MKMINWAEREIELACKRERENAPEEDWNYGCACYESALEVFKTLCNQGHSGMSIKFTQGILNRLIGGKPLIPINDSDFFEGQEDMVQSDENYLKDHNLKSDLQCPRMTSLFRTETLDGRVSYTDVSRTIAINERGFSYGSSLATKLVDELYPIKMPYYPPGKPYKVHMTDFLFDPKNGDLDTLAVFYIIVPEGNKIVINRYFREPHEDEVETYPGWVEISEEEYKEREKNKVEREWMI